MTRPFRISTRPRRPLPEALLAELHHARAQARRQLSLPEAAWWAGRADGLETALREAERAEMGARRA